MNGFEEHKRDFSTFEKKLSLTETEFSRNSYEKKTKTVVIKFWLR